MSMDVPHKLANVFGHVKNARLVSQGQAIEDMAGHINWALSQDEPVVKNEIKNDLQIINRNIAGDVAPDTLANIFGHVKNARLVSQDKDIENMAGHINWALQQPEGVVKNEIHSDGSIIRSNMNIT